MATINLDGKTNEDLIEIKELILAKKEEFAERLITENVIKYPPHIKSDSKELKSWRYELFQIFADGIVLDKETSIQHATEWGKRIAGFLVSIGIPLELSIVSIRFYRHLIGEIIKEEAKKKQFTYDLFFEVLSRFDAIIDQTILSVSLSYEKENQHRIQIAQDALDELSVPIILVAERAGVLPLIGDLDTRRAKILMDKALDVGAAHHLRYLVIDVSGVPIIDTMVANQIFNVVKALKLIGIETKLSGIRPDIALTMVKLNIEFKETLTFSSLHLALESIGVKMKKD
ncbi:STAS domain-containing protein [Scopulibacillus cellulosilyticus]|uniref:STAS domain-containing protein n=1 Tax=Scopulibacillus cellulosilyticus TaxID=2665665 RepID=A0ABW2PR67_9BACL